VRLSMLVCVGNYTIVVLTVLAFSLGFVTNASPLLIRIPFIFLRFTRPLSSFRLLPAYVSASANCGQDQTGMFL